MAVSTKDIIDEVADLLIDSGFDFWSSNEHLINLNEGMKQIIILKPDASVTASEYKLVEGMRQTLPDGSASYQDAQGSTLPQATKLVRVLMNKGTDGISSGRMISLIDLDMLIGMNPLLQSVTGAAEAHHYAYDEKDPLAFIVYPPQPSANQGYVYVIYNSVPPACAAYAADEYIPLNDIYRQPLVFYMLFRAYSKNTDAANSNKAMMYVEAFRTSLGVHNTMEQTEDPNIKLSQPSVSIDRR